VATAVPCDTVASALLSDRFRPLPHVVWARQSDATVLLDAERGLYYTLNEVAGRAWELLAEGEPLIEILRVLGDEYEVSERTLQADVAALLGWLLETHLIERIGP
jgi:Coenzyme PQQ synthesis protein D (PqqD)